MHEPNLKALLEAVSKGETSADDALERLRALPFSDLGFAKIDHHRSLRKGYPETILCAGKMSDQVVKIAANMVEHGSNVLATRCSQEVADALLASNPDAKHHEMARVVTITVSPVEVVDGYVAVLCAGTSDIPVAEEAAVTCESMGNRVERVYDVGVAGIHRLLFQKDVYSEANALVVCAGMEGALASVVAGLVSKPVIAVPTSVGYGASFGGIAALLGMLNSCASGVAVVNIDNGFGAGAFASIVNHCSAGKE